VLLPQKIYRYKCVKSKFILSIHQLIQTLSIKNMLNGSLSQTYLWTDKINGRPSSCQTLYDYKCLIFQKVA
jgi:hypothetical protein